VAATYLTILAVLELSSLTKIQRFGVVDEYPAREVSVCKGCRRCLWLWGPGHGALSAGRGFDVGVRVRRKRKRAGAAKLLNVGGAMLLALACSERKALSTFSGAISHQSLATRRCIHESRPFLCHGCGTRLGARYCSDALDIKRATPMTPSHLVVPLMTLHLITHNGPIRDWVAIKRHHRHAMSSTVDPSLTLIEAWSHVCTTVLTSRCTQECLASEHVSTHTTRSRPSASGLAVTPQVRCGLAWTQWRTF
jgi:hypothetical protein